MASAAARRQRFSVQGPVARAAPTPGRAGSGPVTPSKQRGRARSAPSAATRSSTVAAPGTPRCTARRRRFRSRRALPARIPSCRCSQARSARCSAVGRSPHSRQRHQLRVASHVNSPAHRRQGRSPGQARNEGPTRAARQQGEHQRQAARPHKRVAGTPYCFRRWQPVGRAGYQPTGIGRPPTGSAEQPGSVAARGAGRQPSKLLPPWRQRFRSPSKRVRRVCTSMRPGALQMRPGAYRRDQWDRTWSARGTLCTASMTLALPVASART